MSLLQRILKLQDEVPDERNALNNFLPYRKGAKEFDYEAVGCDVLSSLMGRKLKKQCSYDKFKRNCLDHLKNKLSDDSVLNDLEQMYFAEKTIVHTAPEFLLLGVYNLGNASTRHLSRIFLSFLRDRVEPVAFNSATNFIEEVFLEILASNLEDISKTTDEQCYLPFVGRHFDRDIGFISKHPDYFLEQLANCIELYTFIYCAQLGLSIKNWRDGKEPPSRPLYFILDPEKASAERSRIHRDGYRSLLFPMPDVFPMLTMLEYFNKNEDGAADSLWRYASALLAAKESEQRQATDAILAFAERFRLSRSLAAVAVKGESPIDALAVLFKYSTSQFEAGTGRHRVQEQYMDIFEKRVASSFLQNRGRAGRVLVLNQDFVLLLTNLAIGDRDSLRFQEVLTEFSSRGFCFDKQSQQALIRFYERVGNVDRMSDSGDAVYVRKTI